MAFFFKGDRCRSRLCLLRSGGCWSSAGEIVMSGNAEVLLHTSRPEEGNKSDDTNESGSELEGIDDTRTVPFSNAHGDEVEEGRKDEPGRSTNAEDEVEEALVELSLLAPCSVQAPGEVAPNTDPANKDVDNDKGEKSTLGINELSGSSSLAGGRHDDEEDKVADEVDDGDDDDGPLARKIVVGDSPATGNCNEEDCKDNVGSTHEKLTKDTAAIGTNTVRVVDTPVDHNEEQGEDDQENDTGKDENDRVSDTLTPEEEDSNTVDSSHKKEGNKVEDVKSKQTFLIKADFRAVLVDEVKSVADIKLIRITLRVLRAVQKNNVPEMGTNVIVRLQLNVHRLLNTVGGTWSTHFHTRTALVLVVSIPGVISGIRIDIKNPERK